MQNSDKPLIYLAGPITLGDQTQNVRRALSIAETLIEKGFIPIVPHLSLFWHFIHPHDHGWWLEYDKEIILRCDALLRLPGESIGADWEVDLALKHNIPVFQSVNELVDNFGDNREGNHE